MNGGVLTAAYLVAGVLFIRSLGGLSKQDTAQTGNLFGMLGMAIAIAVTGVSWADRRVSGTGAAMLTVAVVAGAGIGAVLARRVEMTGMPELVAILHSFVGLAAVMVGVSSYLAPTGHDAALLDATGRVVHLLEIWVGIAVGAITLTGSIVAWAKLRGSL